MYVWYVLICNVMHCNVLYCTVMTCNVSNVMQWLLVAYYTRIWYTLFVDTLGPCLQFPTLSKKMPRIGKGLKEPWWDGWYMMVLWILEWLWYMICMIYIYIYGILSNTRPPIVDFGGVDSTSPISAEALGMVYGVGWRWACHIVPISQQWQYLNNPLYIGYIDHLKILIIYYIYINLS